MPAREDSVSGAAFMHNRVFCSKPYNRLKNKTIKASPDEPHGLDTGIVKELEMSFITLFFEESWNNKKNMVANPGGRGSQSRVADLHREVRVRSPELRTFTVKFRNFEVPNSKAASLR